MTRLRSLMVVAAVTVACGLSLGTLADAHKTVVSKYTFTRDVRPILIARCGRCHTDGGVASGALLDYSSARNMAWPIQQELLSRRMPPWSAEGLTVPFKDSQALTPKEFDILMTWAAGGTPEGLPVAEAAPALLSDRADPAAAVESHDLDIGEQPVAIDRDLQAVAFRVIDGPPGASVRVIAVNTDGTRTPIVRARFTPQGPRRYVFTVPVLLSKGSRIELDVTPARAMLWQSLIGGAVSDPSQAPPVRLALDVIAAGSKAP